MCKNHFHFRSIPQFLFLWFVFTKWPPAPILDVRNSLLIAFLAISDRYASLIFFEIFDKMAAVGHFGCPKFTFDRIPGHFRSIRFFFWFFFYKMAVVGHFGCPKLTFDRISGHFRSIWNLVFWNFWYNGCRRPFWMFIIAFLGILDQYRFIF